MVNETHKEDWSLELNLNRMIIAEELAYPESFKEYKNIVIVLSQIKDFYLSEEDILKTLKAKTIEKVLEQYPHILKTAAHWKNENDTFDVKYIDIAPLYNIQPSDPYYDIFFARKLRQLDLLEIDTFLNYHLSNYYTDNLNEFSRFLKICVRKHTNTFLNSESIQTIQEWIDDKEKQQVISLQSPIDTKLGKERKNKAAREAEDKKTCLNQEQTVLLMHYLQQARVFLKDEDLQKIEFGQAFETLTGYSQNTLRQKLAKVSSFHNKENIKEIGNLLTRLQIAIDKDLKQK